jgi:hypothetical protein
MIMQPQQCFFCGHIVALVHVHGHYQCPVCYTNALPCCDGDNCDTNNLLQEKSSSISAADRITDVPAE